MDKLLDICQPSCIQYKRLENIVYEHIALNNTLILFGVLSTLALPNIITIYFYSGN